MAGLSLHIAQQSRHRKRLASKALALALRWWHLSINNECYE
jgi:hypothetical protein